MAKKLSTIAASDYLAMEHGVRRAPSTLRKLRVQGGGPAYFRVSSNEILYDPVDLDAWAAKRCGGMHRRRLTAPLNETAAGCPRLRGRSRTS